MKSQIKIILGTFLFLILLGCNDDKQGSSNSSRHPNISSPSPETPSPETPSPETPSPETPSTEPPPPVTEPSPTEAKILTRILIGIPPEILTNNIYPFSIRYTNNNKNDPLIGVQIKYDNEQFVTNMTSDCESTFAPQNNCTVRGNLNTDKPGNVSFSVIMHYSGGPPQVVTLNSTAVGKNQIIEKTNKDLPSNIAIKTPFPFVFSFTNTSPSITATQITFTPNYPPEFKEISNNCTTSSLLPGASCNVTGEIISNHPTLINLSLTLNYLEGEPVTVSAETTSTTVPVTGEIRMDIPANVITGTTNVVNFRFKNQSADLYATDIHLEYQDESVFSVLSSNCGTTLGPNAWCSIRGTIIPNRAGEFISLATMHYAQGNKIVLKFTSNATDVPLEGAITQGLPTFVEVGKSYPVAFLYTNKSPDTLANDLTFIPPNTMFVLTKNNCEKELRPLHSCSIKGNITPETLTTFDSKLNIKLSYLQGSDVILPLTLNAIPFNSVTTALFDEVPFMSFSTASISLHPEYKISDLKTGFLILKEDQPSFINTFLTELTNSQSSVSKINFTVHGQSIDILFTLKKPECPPNANSFALNSYFSCGAPNASEVFLSIDPFTYATLRPGNYIFNVNLTMGSHLGPYLSQINLKIQVLI